MSVRIQGIILNCAEIGRPAHLHCILMTLGGGSSSAQSKGIFFLYPEGLLGSASAKGRHKSMWPGEGQIGTTQPRGRGLDTPQWPRHCPVMPPALVCHCSPADWHSWWVCHHPWVGIGACASPATESAAQACLMVCLWQYWSSARALC